MPPAGLERHGEMTQAMTGQWLPQGLGFKMNITCACDYWRVQDDDARRPLGECDRWVDQVQWYPRRGSIFTQYSWLVLA